MEDLNTGYFYIGSTFNELKQRKQGHRHKAKINPDRKVYKYLNDWDNIKLSCLELFECDCKMNKDTKEHQYIKMYFDDPFCVNTHLTGTGLTAYQQQKEWRKMNKMKISEWNKQYRMENREKMSQKFECICGSKYSYGNKGKHEKTKKHMNYMNLHA